MTVEFVLTINPHHCKKCTDEMLWKIAVKRFFLNNTFIIKKGRQCKAESDIDPICQKIPAPQYQPMTAQRETEK